MQKEAIFASIV